MECNILNDYNNYLTLHKRVSENTRQSYMRDLRQLSAYLSISIIDATSEHLLNYLHDQKQNGRSPATLSRNIASMKSFYSFLVKSCIRSDNPALTLTAEKKNAKLPQILTIEEVDLLLDQPRCTDLKGYRDKAMLEVLYSSGIRVSELIELRISDICLENGTIICREKNKERIISLQPTAVKALHEYIGFIRKQMIRNKNEERLFVNINGDPMSRQGFWKLLKGYQNKAGIEKNITPHTLRHSFAAHMLQNGTDLNAIQHTLGHSNAATTQMYLQILETG